MIRTIERTKGFKTDNRIQDLIHHRVELIRSEALEEGAIPGWDCLDTDQTTYLVKKHAPHGVIGVARLLPPHKLHPHLQKALPDHYNQIPFVLADCYFHVPDDNVFSTLPQDIYGTHFQCLLDAFYRDLMKTLETKAVQAKMPVVYAFLSEEDFDFLSTKGGRQVFCGERFDQGPHAQDLIACQIVMQDEACASLKHNRPPSILF